MEMCDKNLLDFLLALSGGTRKSLTVEARLFTRRIRQLTLILFLSGLGLSSVRADKNAILEAIQVRDVFLRVKDEAVLPALERGQLKQISIEPGDNVLAGQTVAVLDDVEAGLSLELARIDVEIAMKEHQDSVDVAIQTGTLEEGKMLLEQARLEAEVAKAVASSDIAMNQAMSDGEFSKQELERALAARKEFSSSVSEQQLAKLTLIRDQNSLAVELARHNQSMEILRSRSKDSFVMQQQTAVRRLENILLRTERQYATEELNIKSLQKQVAIAEERLERRKLRAPFAGVVTEKKRNAGEWVEAGEPVLRIIRLDVLHVEGYVAATQITPQFRGRKVKVSCEDSATSKTVEGTIVFVSPEIDPVSKQVQIRAEIANVESLFRPGQSAQMSIEP